MCLTPRNTWHKQSLSLSNPSQAIHNQLLLFAGQEPISWADLIVLAAKVAHVQLWTSGKVKRASVAADGSTIAEAFGAAFPVPLGRVDATSADRQVSIPQQGASAAEVKVSSGNSC